MSKPKNRYQTHKVTSFIPSLLQELLCSAACLEAWMLGIAGSKGGRRGRSLPLIGMWMVTGGCWEPGDKPHSSPKVRVCLPLLYMQSTGPGTGCSLGCDEFSELCPDALSQTRFPKDRVHKQGPSPDTRMGSASSSSHQPALGTQARKQNTWSYSCQWSGHIPRDLQTYPDTHLLPAGFQPLLNLLILLASTAASSH